MNGEDSKEAGKSAENSQEPGKSAENSQMAGKKVSGWGRVKDSRLLAGLVGGVAAIVGAIIVMTVNTGIGEAEAHSRNLDLLSRREAAAQNLQAQVFDIYVQKVVPVLGEKGNDYKKVALLAGLHGNFSEFFDTRPVFEAFAKTVEDPGARHELIRLAKRVARRQAEFIKAHTPPVREQTMDRLVELSYDTSGKEIKFNLAVHDVTLSIAKQPHRHYSISESGDEKGKNPALGDSDDDLIDDVSDFVTIKVEFSMDPELHHQMANNGEGHMKKRLSMTFELSYMDTPYMDNMWMKHGDGSHNQIALRLIDINTKGDKHTVKVEAIHFPGTLFSPTQRLPFAEMEKGGH